MSDCSEIRPPRPAIRAMSGVEWGMLVFLAIIWGGSFFFIAVGVRTYDPFTVVVGRVVPAALVLWIAAVLMGQRLPRDWASWRAFLVMGALNAAIPHSLIVWGQTEIESGLAAILNATTPLFTIIVAHGFTRDERLSGMKLFGVVMGIAGVAVLVGPEVLGGLTAQGLGRFAVLGAALSYGFAAVYGRRFHGQPPIVSAAGQLTGTAIFVVPVMLVFEAPWARPFDGGAAAAILGLSLLSTALAYVIYFRILATAGATNVALVTFLIPVTAIALGAVFLGERLTAMTFGGFVLILIGLAAVDGRVFSRVIPRGRSARPAGQP